MVKNLKAKTRPVDKPYEVYSNGSWTWRVLKHYQSPENEAKNPYARVFTFVTSPYCPEGELGDTYLKDITGNARLVEQDGEVVGIVMGNLGKPEPGKVYALTGPNSIASGKTWAEAEVEG